MAPGPARLAIDGGEPVRATLLPYAHQVIDERDIEAVTAALRSEWLTTGPRVPEFEAGLVQATGAGHAVAFSSGTAALHGAAAVAGLGPGDEAITTPMTFVASANAVLYTGATPRFADVDPDSLLIDPAAVAAAVTERTRAIIPVDYAGQPADYTALRAIADAAPGGPLTIIADASHSLGATFEGRPVGTLADMTVLSLHPAKIMTTGEGGAVLTDREDLAAALRRFRNHGIETELAARRDWTYAMVDLGYNYRLTDIAAALGSAQLERLEEWLARRRRLAAGYLERLAGHPALELPAVDPRADPAWHFMFVRLRLDRLTVDRGAIFHALRAEGIGVNVHYIPVHRHPYYEARFPGLSFPVAEAAYERLLTLPLHAGMSDADLDDVVAGLDKVTGAYAGDGAPASDSRPMSVSPAPPAPAPASRLPALPAVPGWARMVVLAGILTVLAWPIANLPARATLDGSWQIALHLAAGLGLRHGVEFVFTYGPLGFLGFPIPYLDLTSTVALTVSVAIYLALIGTMLVEARRLLPLWAAFLVTLLVARIFVLLPPFEAFQALIFIWCVEALADRIPLPTSALAAIGGVLAGAAVLGKVSVGIFAVAMVGATVVSISRRPWGSVGVFVVATVASGLGFWLATGQHLEDLGAFARGVYEVISGYNSAMGGDFVEKRRWLYLALPAVAAILIWTGWRSSRDWPRPRRIGLAILAVIFGFALWKLAVVREHVTFVFATAVVAMFPFATGVDRRTWLVSTLAIGIAFAGSSAIEPKTYLNVVGSARSILNEVRHSFQPDRMERAAASTQENLREWYELDPNTLAAIGGETVHVDPVMASAAYAYPDLRWKPLPVIQAYTAYTPVLDQLNADTLRSTDAPQRILRNVQEANHTDRLREWIDRPFVDGEFFPVSVDGRFRWFESPAAMLETFCRYDEISVTERWQVLARTARSCGPPESLGTVTARAGEPVTIPLETRPDRFVTVKIGGLEPSLLGRVRDALYKAPDWYVKLDDTRYRLIPGTAGDGLLVAVPQSADGTGRFAFGSPIRTITVTQGDNGKGSQEPLTFTFESVPRGGP